MRILKAFHPLDDQGYTNLITRQHFHLLGEQTFKRSPVSTFVENVGHCFPEHVYQNCLLGLFKTVTQTWKQPRCSARVELMSSGTSSPGAHSAMEGTSYWYSNNLGEAQRHRSEGTSYWYGDNLGEARRHCSEGKKTVSQLASCAIPDSRRKNRWWRRRLVFTRGVWWGVGKHSQSKPVGVMGLFCTPMVVVTQIYYLCKVHHLLKSGKETDKKLVCSPPQT